MASGLGWIILKCLQKGPATRYQTAEELLSDLAFLEKGRAPGPLTTPLPSPWAERRGGIKEKGARCHLYRSFYLTHVERHEEAVAEVVEAQRLDPISSLWRKS